MKSRNALIYFRSLLSQFTDLIADFSHVLRDCTNPRPEFVLVFFTGILGVGVCIVGERLYFHRCHSGAWDPAEIYFDGAPHRKHRHMRPARLLLSIAVTMPRSLFRGPKSTVRIGARSGGAR